MAKREFLQLAHAYKPEKHGIAGWYMSEKLDGMRAYWDGGITRGMLKSDVPWANTEKDGRYKESPVATGLWSRYGNVIHAPDYWLNDLPKIPLDGEIWAGREARQFLMETVKDLEPGVSWLKVKYHVFDMPSYGTIFADGRINNTNFKKTFKDIMVFVKENWSSNLVYLPKSTTRFESTYQLMCAYIMNSKYVERHDQWELRYGTDFAIQQIEHKLKQITNMGGEGLILRNPNAIYVCERVHHVLKVKKLQDAEATVIGYVTGRKTDKGSRLLGLMGAMIVDYNGKRLELSGFTDQERVLTTTAGYGGARYADEWARDNPEEECPMHVYASMFPRGSRITFRYRGLSRDGIPQEARYWRRKEVE